ncbi:hypothetical protein SAMN05421544_10720 [Riemerella columbipharyngis]|uniref:Glycosyltransferase RgtA/B/C/D-like domain-containing protein n=2 Tax=Riemerella columbipharyngis TaxID=1071918 RepID=A0A1G7C140_9FLAO|nr:hypothetical protein SAMN05421544_10720 [Riemerella columbipharyngis]
MFLMVNLLILLPSLRFFIKFSIYHLFFIYLVLANISMYYLLKNIKKYYNIFNYPFWIIFIGGLSILNFYIYPIIDARRNIGKGSTGDDAMILASKSLMSTGKLYDLMIDAKTPISPGPAWVIFNAPFSIFDLYFLLSPFYLLIILLVIRKFFGNLKTNLFTYYLFCSVIAFELFFNGHDMLPFSLAFTSLSILINKVLTEKTNISISIILGLLLGICSTSRIVFFFIPLIFFILLKPYNYKNAIVLFVVSFLICLFFNIYYFLINDFYQPIHLLFKGKHLLSDYGFLLGITGFCLFNYFLFKKLITTNVNWYFIIAITFSIVTIPFSIGDLIHQNFNFTEWEGANYLVITIPHFIIYFIDKLNIKKRPSRLGRSF